MDLYTVSVVTLGLSVAVFGISLAIAYHGNKQRKDALSITLDNVTLVSHLTQAYHEFNKAKVILAAVRLNNFSFRHLTSSARRELARILQIEDVPIAEFNRYRRKHKIDRVKGVATLDLKQSPIEA